MISMFNHRLGKKLASFLSKSPPSYERFDDISLEDLAFVLEAGDIVLVEGDTRISTAIKYLTQSSWSHACLYVGEHDSGVRDLRQSHAQWVVRLYDSLFKLNYVSIVL